MEDRCPEPCLGKRMLDFCGAALGLLILSPVLIAFAIVVVLTSGFPILFRQRRVGRNGCDFTLYKFRTMTVLAGAEKGVFEAGDTRRITRIGRFLRKTKLDELPQLWNVLLGDMSLVGPRPEVRKWVEAYPERWAKVLQVCPGITDPGAILFRHEEEILKSARDPEQTYRDFVLPRKLDLYEQYVDSHSMFTDLKILVRTFVALFRSSRITDVALSQDLVVKNGTKVPGKVASD